MRRFQVPALFAPALWSRARWWRVSFLLPPDRPPVFVLLFRDLAAGCAIFQAWQAALGEIDVDGFLRVAIVEDGTPACHVHLSFNVETIHRAAARYGGVNTDDAAIVADAWCHMRMPSGGVFRPFFDHLDAHGRYLLVPATSEGGTIAIPYLGVGKQELAFRHARDVHGVDDPDRPWASASLQHAGQGYIVTKAYG